jgi:hypothetical protein
MSELQKRKASPMQSERCCSVPWAKVVDGSAIANRTSDANNPRKRQQSFGFIEISVIVAPALLRTE